MFILSLDGRVPSFGVSTEPRHCSANLIYLISLGSIPFSVFSFWSGSVCFLLSCWWTRSTSWDDPSNGQWKPLANAERCCRWVWTWWLCSSPPQRLSRLTGVRAPRGYPSPTAARNGDTTALITGETRRTRAKFITAGRPEMTVSSSGISTRGSGTRARKTWMGEVRGVYTLRNQEQNMVYRFLEFY